MKIVTLAAVALLAVASSALANTSQSLPLTFGSEECKAGASGSCHGAATPQPISFFLEAGQTVEDIAPLNENLVLKPGMTVPPFTMIRLR